MRNFVLSLTVVLLASCHGAEDSGMKNLKTVDLKLADSLGQIRFAVPARYDTGFTWTHQSDCGKPCDKIKYRYQPKALPIFRESGFYFYPLKDSIEQFTISHSAYPYPFQRSTDSSIIVRYHQMKKASALQDPDMQIIKSDTIEKIGDRYFSVIVIDKYDTSKAQYCKKLLASTYINGNEVNLNYELLTKQKSSINDNFIENAGNLLHTIRVSNGQ